MIINSMGNLYGMWTPLSVFFWELSCAMQYPKTMRDLLMLFASVRSLPSLFVFLVISEPRREKNTISAHSQRPCLLLPNLMIRP